MPLEKLLEVAEKYRSHGGAAAQEAENLEWRNGSVEKRLGICTG